MTKQLRGSIHSTVLLVMLFLAWSAYTPSYAQSSPNDLSQCLVLKTTGEDRLVLVKWISMALLAHPALSADIKVTQSQIDQANQKMANLFFDLLTVKCHAPAKAVIGADATGMAFRDAFSILGQVSAQEIFGNEIVVKRTSDFMGLVDANKLREALQ